jgi:hypothetical protein
MRVSAARSAAETHLLRMVQDLSYTKSWLFTPHISYRAAREARGTVIKELRCASRGATP